jgi:hypothetical protein
MICSSFNICQCSQSFYYFDSKIQTCNPQGSYLASCNIDYNCRVDLYLECVNSKCTCISPFPIWSIGFNKCIVPGNYSDTCFSTSDCSTNKSLICSNGTSCSCPTNLLAGKCDCPARISGNEMYWDGSICVSALSKNQSCSADYKCQTLTQATTCISGVCNCLSTEYFKITNSKCESLLLINETCNQSDACNSGKGLSCVATICQCNSTQFWKSNSSGCINYYSYNQGTCSSDNQCKANTNLICRISGASCQCPTTVSNGFCDCPTRVANKELYWNGSSCVEAGEYGDTCTDWYQCKVLTNSYSLSCYACSSKCSCSDCFWNNITKNCDSCITGWTCHNSACYKGYEAYKPFKNTLTTYITTNCKYGTSTKVNTLSTVSDWSGCNSGNATALCLIAQQVWSSIDMFFLGPVNSMTCNTIEKCDGTIGTHDCTHGESHHGMLCKYSV